MIASTEKLNAQFDFTVTGKIQMRTRLLILFLTFGLFARLTAYGDGAESKRTGPMPGAPSASSSSADSAGFFGLSVGNIWFYSFTTNYLGGRDLYAVRKQIVGTTLDGVCVVAVDSIRLSRKGKSIEYWYDDGHGRLYLSATSAIDIRSYPKYDASIQRDTTISCCYDPTYYHLFSTTIFAVPVNAQEFITYQHYSVGSSNQFWVSAPGYGFLGSGAQGGFINDLHSDSLRLKGMVKNGVALGDTSFVSDSLRVARAPSGLTSTLSASRTSIRADCKSSLTMTMRARDRFGNNIAQGGASVSLREDLGGLDISSPTDHGNGTYTWELTSSRWSPATITITGTINKETIPGGIRVNLTDASPSAVTSVLSASPGEIIADGISAATITVELRSASGDTATNYSSSGVTLQTTLGSLGSVVDNGDGTLSAKLTSSKKQGLAVISGAFFSTPFADTASVRFIHDPAIPTEFSLEQNYPNPFNMSTVIRYGIPADGHATLSVYNVLGERVAVLTDADVKVGYYPLNFDGSGFPSGVYIYRLTTGSFVAAKRMMLIK